MRLLSRVVFTFALLGGLAYGSYAFGKYVLSSRLFGNQGSKLNQNFGESAVVPAPRAASGKSAQTATASVELLPESGDSGVSSKPAGGAIDPATSPDRSNASGDDGTARPGAADIIGDPGSSADEASRPATAPERPRKRRKRRKPRVTPIPSAPDASAAEEPARQTYSSDPDPVISDGGETASNQQSEPAPRAEPRRETPREASGNDTPREAPPRETPPRRRRTRVRVETPAPRERTRIEPRRETPARRVEESPVPVPEGSGGGESPVPVPE